MRLSAPRQAVKIRHLAAELRGHAAQTNQRDYQETFERTALELDEVADLLERRSQFSTSSKSN